VKEERGPLRLCGEGKLAEVICAVVLVRVEENQFHLGLRRDKDEHETVLHLAWHRYLRDQPLVQLIEPDRRMLPAAAIALSLDPLVNEALQILTSRIAARYARRLSLILYGFGDVSTTFAQATGHVIDHDAAFTCATFVLAMLRSVGVDLIDTSRWRAPTAEDVRWQRDIGEKLLAWIAEHVHGDLARAKERVERDLGLGTRRYRPTDVAGAALFGPDTWPVGVEEVDPRARELESMLSWPGSSG
jgi:hypothetical protein